MSRTNLWAACNAICQSGKFETGEGTCALTCMQQLGDARKNGCPYVIDVHGPLGTAVCRALGVKVP